VPRHQNRLKILSSHDTTLRVGGTHQFFRHRPTRLARQRVVVVNLHLVHIEVLHPVFRLLVESDRVTTLRLWGFGVWRGHGRRG
jgi:hypothetical protein